MATEGHPIEPEIMFPLVCSDKEIEEVAFVVENAADAAAMQITELMREAKEKEEEGEGHTAAAKQEYEQQLRGQPKGSPAATEPVPLQVHVTEDEEEHGLHLQTGEENLLLPQIPVKSLDASLKYRMGAMIEGKTENAIKTKRVLTIGAQQIFSPEHFLAAAYLSVCYSSSCLHAL